MIDIRNYNSKITEVSKSILLELSALLKEYIDNIVLIGGWAPYFILKKYKSKETEFEHIGSVDIDIALDIKKIPDLDKVYESIRHKLERNGYKIRKSKNNQSIPHSFEKRIGEMLIHIDFLASEYGGTGKAHRHQRVQDIMAHKARGIDIAFKDNEEFEIEAFLSNKAKYRGKIRISGIVAILIMKIIAFDSDISRTKDTYDIYSILKYYKGGVTSVIDEINHYSKYGLVKEALGKLPPLFGTIGSVGPTSLADFMLPENINSEDWEFYRRDIFELIQNFLKRVKR